MARRKNSAEAFEIFRKIAEKEARARASREAGERSEGSAKRRHESAKPDENSEGTRFPAPSRLRGREALSEVRKEPLLGRPRRTAEAGAQQRPLPSESRLDVFASRREQVLKPGAGSIQDSDALAARDAAAPVSRWLTRSRRTRPRLRRAALLAQDARPVRAQRPVPQEALALPGPGAPREVGEPPFVADTSRPVDEELLAGGLVERQAPPPGCNRLHEEDDLDVSPPHQEVGEHGYSDTMGNADGRTETGDEDALGGETPAPVGAADDEVERRDSIPVEPPLPEDELEGEGEPAFPQTRGFGSAARCALLACQIGGWLVGDGFTRWLRRPVELRLSTLVLGTLVLVITLALIGIYLKKPATEDRFYRNMYGRGNTPAAADAGQDPGADSGSVVAASPGTLPAFRRIPAFRRPAFSPASRRAPATQSLPEFRDVGTLAAPEEKPEEEDTESSDAAWVRVRSSMDAVECSKLVDFLKERLALVDQGPDKIGGKRVVPKKRDRLWRVYIGPFRTRADATGASKHLKELARQNASFVFDDIRNYFDGAYAANGPESS